MAFEVPVDDVETDAIGGFDRVVPGSYHMAIAFVDEEGGKKGEMLVDFEVLRGTVSNQEGKVHREYFSKDSKAFIRKKLFALAIAAGLITKQQLDQHKANGTSPSLDFTSIVGRQVCMNLSANEYEGKISTRMTWDEVFPVVDKRANHIPLHAAFLAKANIVLPPGRNVDGAVSTITAKPAPAKPAAAPAQQAANVDALLSGL